MPLRVLEKRGSYAESIPLRAERIKPTPLPALPYRTPGSYHVLELMLHAGRVFPSARARRWILQFAVSRERACA